MVKIHDDEPTRKERREMRRQRNKEQREEFYKPYLMEAERKIIALHHQKDAVTPSGNDEKEG